MAFLPSAWCSRLVYIRVGVLLRFSLILSRGVAVRVYVLFFQKEVFAINSINLFVLSSHVILSKYYCSLKTINVLVHWLSLYGNLSQRLIKWVTWHTVTTLYSSLTAFIHNGLIFEFDILYCIKLIEYSFSILKNDSFLLIWLKISYML